MAEQWQHRRGTTLENSIFTGANGEISVDTQTHEIRVHDGSTVGGHILAKKATTLNGYGITDGADTALSNLTNTGKANVSKLGTYNVNETYDIGSVGATITNINSSMVTLTGSQTISGTKTFTSNIYMNKNGPYIELKNQDVDLSTNISGTKYATISAFKDKNSRELAYIRQFSAPESSKNVSGLELIAVDPVTTHYNNRILGADNKEYVYSTDDATNGVRVWKYNNTNYYTVPNGSQPAVGANVYSNIAHTTVATTVSQVGGTRINASITLKTDGTNRNAYLNYKPYAIASTTDTTIATLGWVNDPSYSCNVVHRSGNETIKGEKYYLKDSSSNTAVPIIFKNMDVEQLTASSTYSEQMLYGIDKNAKRIASVGFAVDTQGRSRAYLSASKYLNGNWVYSNIDTYVDLNGNCTCYLPTNTYGTYFHGTADSAKWADLAECYQSDEKYPVGTLIKFGGEKDITIADNKCNGVISDKPGYLLDSDLEDSQPVALIGKTPIRIIGKIKKFDTIVLDPEHPGVGKEQTTSDEKVIAIALENNDHEEEKLVKCVTKFVF